MSGKLTGADMVWSDAQGAYVLKNNVKGKRIAAMNAGLPLHEHDQTQASMRAKSAAKAVEQPKAKKALKRKVHERKACSFRVSNAEADHIALALRRINAENHARGDKMRVAFTLSDMLRGACLTLADEVTSDLPDWAGILADIRRAMP